MFEKIKNDFLPSFIVFLVALPLCMGIAIASGLPPISGIVSGVVGGILVGSLSGSPLQVSGPAAGLAVIVWQLVEKFGVEGLGFVILFTGIFQIAMGALKLGQLFRAISPAIIQGMLAGIGTLILLSQWHVMLDSQPMSSGLRNLLAIPTSVMNLITKDVSVSVMAFFLGVAALMMMVLWPKVSPKKVKWIPGSLLAVITLTLVAQFFSLPVKRIELPDNLFASMSFISIDQFATLNWMEILLAAITVAIVATAETLLSANAVDQMHNGPRANYDKELLAQGVGNTLCGILGALPMTGVIVRSGANVQAGATSRASTILHGTWLLLFVMVFPFVLEMIPVSVLAAVLVFTGYKLLNPSFVTKLWSQSRTEVMVFLATYLTVVLVDLMKGILAGLALAILNLLYVLTHVEVETKSQTESKRVDLHINGTATFLRLPKIIAAFDSIPSNYDVHVHLDKLAALDHACLDLFECMKKRFENAGGSFVVEWEHLHNKFNNKKAKVRSA